MRFFDLHCDTADLCLKNDKTFTNNNFHIDFSKAKYIDTYIQCAAAFIPDKLKGKKALEHCISLLEIIEKENYFKNRDDIKNSKFPLIIPTVENCSALCGDIKNVDIFKKYNVKIATLTWNDDNQIGSGVKGTGKGLSDFGKQVLIKFEQEGVIPDISHACEKLFWDVCENADKKIIASHSCAKRICSNSRNLTDEQIKELIKRKSLIGINFYKDFLNNDGDKSCIDDIINHCDYILSLGGEEILGIGSDFDGCDLPKDIKGIESIGEIYNRFLQKNYSEILLDKIFFKNAYDFVIAT